MWAGQPAVQVGEFRQVGKLSRRAIRKAWQALCWTELGFGLSIREKRSALKQARTLASRLLQDWSTMLSIIARPMVVPPVGPRSSRLARAFLKKTVLEKAICALRQATRLTPAETSVYTDLGKVYIERGRYREAVAALRVATHLEPSSSDPWGLLALAYARQERQSLAEEAAKRSLENIGNAPQESLRSAALAMDTLKMLYEQIDEQIEAFKLARRDRRQAMSRLRFILWDKRRVFQISYRLSGRNLAGVAGAMQELNYFLKSTDALREKISGFGQAAMRVRELQVWVDIKALSSKGPRSPDLLQALLQASIDKSDESIELAQQYISALRDTEEGTLLLEILRRTASDKSNQDGGRRDENVPRITLIEKLVRAWIGRDDERIAPLQALLEEKRLLGHDWEVAEIGETLAALYLNLRRLREAKECLDQTIKHLERSIHSEIQRRHLYVLSAKILREQGNPGKALEQARIGVARDPVASYERNELGCAYDSLAEYASAQSVWEDALLLDPENPALHVNLGLAHLRQMEDSKDKTERLARLEAAVLSLKTALKLYEDTNPSQDTAPHDARFLLSLVYSEAGYYPDAIRELRALDRRDYCDLAVAIYLAEAYLDNEDWAEAERRFREIAADVDIQMGSAKEGPNEIVKTPPGAGDMVLGTVAAYAHLGLANALAEREIFPGRALDEVLKARDAIRDLDRANLKESWAGRCTFFEGVILTKLGRIDKAIAKLETALEECSDAQTHFALANALARRAEKTTDPTRKMEAVRRALHYYQETQRLDWNGELEAKVSKAIAQLQPVK
jgi:tetratricopeptide (TPR) repeat protein